MGRQGRARDCCRRPDRVGDLAAVDATGAAIGRSDGPRGRYHRLAHTERCAISPNGQARRSVAPAKSATQGAKADTRPATPKPMSCSSGYTTLSEDAGVNRKAMRIA